MQRYILPILLLTLMALIGCGDSNDPTAAVEYPSGASLLGLTETHTVHYQIIDSIVTYDPYLVIMDTTNLYLAVAPGVNQQVVLRIDGNLHDLLTIDSDGILHTAQFVPDGTPPDTIIYFFPTPIIIPASTTANQTWTVNTPLLTEDSQEQRRSVLFMHYGFSVSRTFRGQQTIVVPASSYNTYYFESDLYLNESDTIPTLTAEEFFAEGVGLVQQILRSGNSYKRLVILLEDN